MQKLSNIIREEWIGRAINITHATNATLVRVTGKVVDETKHLLVIETGKGLKRVPKKGTVFQIKYLGKKVEIPGELIFSSPDERIKAKVLKNGRRMQ